MKKVLKIFGYIILALLLLIAVLIVTASLSQKKIVDAALNRIYKNKAVSIEIEDLSFTLIKRFPYATLEFSGVRIAESKTGEAKAENSSVNEVLYLKSVFISVKTRPLFEGKYEIVKIEINDSRINYSIDASGKDNISFLKNLYNNQSAAKNKENSSVLDLNLFRLRNTMVIYTNDTAQIAANLFFPDLDMKGKIANENYSGNIEGILKLSDCNFKNTNLDRLDEATINFQMDYENDTLRIKRLEAKTDGASFDITGKMAFLNHLFIDLDFATQQLETEKLIKYVPDELISNYDIIELRGLLSASGRVKGVLSDSVVPAMEINFNFKNGFAKIKDYPAFKNIGFEGHATNGNEQNLKTTTATFGSFHAETDSSAADMVFSLSNFEQPEFTLNSKLKINVEEFKNHIPDTLIQNISGKITAQIKAKGIIPDSINSDFIDYMADNISANISFDNFNIEKDSIKLHHLSGNLVFNQGEITMNDIKLWLPDYDLNLTNISFDAEFTGTINHPQNLAIHFKSFFGETPQGNVRGSATINNIEHPSFVIDAHTTLYLDQLQQYLPDTLIKNISGTIEAEISSFGTINPDSIEKQIETIIYKQSTITAEAKNVSATLTDTLFNFTGLNALATFKNDTLLISKINGNIARTRFSLDSAKMVNLYKAFLKNGHEKIIAQGNLKLGAIDFINLAPLIPGETPQNISSESNLANSQENKQVQDIEKRNFSFEIKGKVSAESFKHEKIRLDNISAKFNFSDSVYIVDQLKTDAFDGSANSSLRYSNVADGRQIINIKSSINRMDIKKLLFAFDNFGQDSLITHENISGLFSANMHSRFVFVADTLVPADMRMKAAVTLENGRLVNYQPAMDVANFTGIKELDNIDLKTLKSNIFLFKNQLYVPITDVVSTSLDFSTFGMQSLEENYEYHIQLRLGDVLTGKSKQLIERQSKSGDEVSGDEMDKNTIKIIYANMDGKQKTGFATKKAQRSMELKIQVQEKMLDLIFHPAIVSFETGVE
jgi:hypothetical protein